jgi:KaiC/GvpD/RAD55 family RecA-like ATPase
MIKHKDNFEGHQVVASLKKNQVWCYSCDEMVETIIQQAKMFNEDASEDPELIAFEAFFENVCAAFVDVNLAGSKDTKNKIQEKSPEKEKDLVEDLDEEKDSDEHDEESLVDAETQKDIA